MMTDEERIELQRNNPLHGLKLETMLHYKMHGDNAIAVHIRNFLIQVI